MQQIKSNNDISLSINTIKCFLRDIGEKYSLTKKTDNSPEDLKSPEATVNESSETITSTDNDTNSKESTQESTNKDDLLNLFQQFYDFAQLL